MIIAKVSVILVLRAKAMLFPNYAPNRYDHVWVVLWQNDNADFLDVWFLDKALSSARTCKPQKEGLLQYSHTKQCVTEAAESKCTASVAIYENGIIDPYWLKHNLKTVNTECYMAMTTMLWTSLGRCGTL